MPTARQAVEARGFRFAKALRAPSGSARAQGLRQAGWRAIAVMPKGASARSSGPGPKVTTPDTVSRVAARIAEHDKAHELSRVEVVLHGGEPLLAGAA